MLLLTSVHWVSVGEMVRPVGSVSVMVNAPDSMFPWLRTLMVKVASSPGATVVLPLRSLISARS